MPTKSEAVHSDETARPVLASPGYLTVEVISTPTMTGREPAGFGPWASGPVDREVRAHGAHADSSTSKEVERSHDRRRKHDKGSCRLNRDGIETHRLVGAMVKQGRQLCDSAG